MRRRRRVTQLQRRRRSFWYAEPNIAPIDRYTVAHFWLGLLYGTPSSPWYVPLGLSLLFELVERPAKAWNPEMFPAPAQDSWINSLLDTAAVMAGWAVMKTTLNWVEREMRTADQPG